MTFLPIADSLPARRRAALFAAAGMIVLTIAVAAMHAIFGVGGTSWNTPIRDWASSLVYVVVAGMVLLRVANVRDSRGPWTVFAIGITLYGAGNLLWAMWLEHVADPPIPSVCDVLWLSLYPSAYIGIAWLARGGRRVAAGVWLDGVVAGLGIAAVGAAVVFPPVLDAAEGSALAVTTNLAYPIGDLLLAVLVMGVLALRGWRLDRKWALLGSGFLTLCVADWIYLLQVANGSSDSSTVANLFYMTGVALIAFAAWQPPTTARAPRLDGWSVLLVPAGFVVVALALLTYDHVDRLGALGFALAMLTVVVALVRTGLTFRDVRALAETRRQAVTDDLTALPNRRLLMRRLEEAIAAARVTGGTPALLMVDLDHFKELNDTLGHHAGDLLLRQIGPRLTRGLRSTDTVARLGGDEFAVVLGEPIDDQGALAAADKILSLIRAPFELRGLKLHVAASIGIALFPDHGDTADDLLQRADVAMYEAKGARTGREIYARERDTHSRERLELVGELRRALDEDELELHFQPQADAAGRQIVGVEALVRWRHPVRGMLGPLVFVPLIEQSGMARELTRWVLDRALAQSRAWRDGGIDVWVSVNVTSADVLNAALAAEVGSALLHHGVPPEALVLEVTESSVLSDPVRVGTVLSEVGDLGVALSLDDFGTGYSSLTHLKALPVDEVKIDRSFVMSMRCDQADAAIVGSTIHLAHNLGMRVVAEGVEDDETWDGLVALGCDLIQGYGLSRPLPAADLQPLLDERAVRATRA